MSFHVGDTEPALSGVLGVDLTGAESAEVHVRRPDAAILSRTVAVVDAETGAWSAVWESGDLDIAGVWECEVEVTWSAERIQTFAAASFRVYPEIDNSGPTWSGSDEELIDGGVL